ncbi:AraC family transcriptional regulator [Pseudomonas sp. GV071]|uniref:AraC family transcriptional regulator n=1 Tax=Pseudomonas sp. GV071 TaxID=2135754 RepID=UPI000D3385FD|nr:AraC family transcriptional regulator [Pseudomonas sp. GV071]PTQ68377.1 AraC family transcriptional regulator [Pseudomonas sp. GV071]
MPNTATPTWPTRRSAISAQLLTQFGLDQGLALDTCLAGTGLDLALLADPGAEIDATQELLLIGNLVTALGHIPGIGIKAGLRYQLNTYGIWGFAMLSSANFRDAAHLGLRYLDLTYAFSGMRLEERDDEAHFILDSDQVPAALAGFILERDLAGVLSIQRDLTAVPMPLTAVCLTVAEPADLSLYLDLLGVRPQFNARENRLIFPRALLDRPLPGANPQVMQHCEQQCQALLAKRRVRGGLSGRIRDRLLAQPGRLPDMEQLADELHMTSRTLRRRLLAENSSYRLLLEEVRQALAEELLGTGGLTLEEIAERLGYGEMSNFMHAFKRWKGVTPGQFRRSGV